MLISTVVTETKQFYFRSNITHQPKMSWISKLVCQSIWSDGFVRRLLAGIDLDNAASEKVARTNGRIMKACGAGMPRR